MKGPIGFLGIIAGVGFAAFGLWLLVFTYATSTMMSPAKRATEYWATVISRMTSLRTGGLWGTFLGLTLVSAGLGLFWLGCKSVLHDDARK